MRRSPRAAARGPVVLVAIALLAWTPHVGAEVPPAGAAPAAPGPSAAGATTALDAARAAEEAFRHRDDARHLDEAIARFREAARLAGSDPAPRLGLARAQAFRALSSDAEARDAWAECARAGESALRLLAPAFAEATDRGEGAASAASHVDAHGAEALYWLALGTMGFAQARGLSAVLSVRLEARAMMERAAHLDERVDSGGPARALGAWLASVPAAAGGGAAASRTWFDRARALAPEYQLTRVREAQTLAVLLQDRARFEARLGEVLAFDDARAPALGPENRLAKRLARSLLARRDRLF